MVHLYQLHVLLFKNPDVSKTFSTWKKSALVEKKDWIWLCWICYKYLLWCFSEEYSKDLDS